jgi:ribosomal protein L20
VVKDAQRKEILSFEKGYFGEQPFEKAAELIIRTIEGNLFDQK